MSEGLLELLERTVDVLEEQATAEEQRGPTICFKYSAKLGPLYGGEECGRFTLEKDERILASITRFLDFDLGFEEGVEFWVATMIHRQPMRE